jgi:hypothetical protein
MARWYITRWANVSVLPGSAGFPADLSKAAPTIEHEAAPIRIASNAREVKKRE